jgi:signal transduction histidine kinase
MERNPSTVGRTAVSEASLRQLHEMAQPLTVLRGMLELALIETQTVEQYRHSVESALKEASRAISCLDELRRIIRSGQPVDDYSEKPEPKKKQE